MGKGILNKFVHSFLCLFGDTKLVVIDPIFSTRFLVTIGLGQLVSYNKEKYEMNEERLDFHLKIVTEFIITKKERLIHKKNFH